MEILPKAILPTLDKFNHPIEQLHFSSSKKNSYINNENGLSYERIIDKRNSKSTVKIKTEIRPNEIPRQSSGRSLNLSTAEITADFGCDDSLLEK